MQHKLLLVATLILLSIGVKAQNYEFNGTMSREVLENYLDKAITMQGQSDIEGMSNLSEPERVRNIQMIDDIGAKFIGRIAGWWESGWGQVNHDNLFAKCSLNVADIKANDPDVICQGAVFEYVSTTVGTFRVPAYVFTAFGLPVQNRNFSYSAMQYPAPASQYKLPWNYMTEAERQFIPDITQLESQMWFYYMATRYISSGCEAIHFGQAEIMNRRDVGNKVYWSLIQKIRAFAATRNRGVVLCDAHMPFKGMYYEPELTMSQADWQNYHPNATADKQLVWDFHSLGVIYTKENCTATKQEVSLQPFPVADGLIRASLGGRHPQGWYCVSNPTLNEYDNGGVESVVGCANNDNWNLWGWDGVSWFGLQQEPYRNDILKYTYYKMKCLDKNAHLIVTGMRGITPGGGNLPWLYRANTGFQNQQVTIRNIWNGTYTGSSNWIHHNFTNEEVYNQPSSPNVSASLIFQGNELAFYIGNDGYIHGYVKNNGATGVWRTVSPSYAAAGLHSQPVSTQVKAANSLIVSPDGNTLLYVGVDGYVHGFTINNVWDYTYFNFPSASMASQNIKAVKNLQFTSNDRLFYIAHEAGTNKKRVHGFIRTSSGWVTTSPTHASQVFSGSHTEVAGALTYNAYDGRLYYVGVDGFLYYHTIVNDWQFTYNIVPQASLISQNLRIIPNDIAVYNNKVFYVGQESGSAQRIHALVDNAGSWSTVSPSHSANIYNGQPLSNQVQPLGTDIAVSPNGQNIAYIGADRRVYYYKDISGGWNFSYHKTYGADANSATASLQFTDNNTLFYTSTPYSVPPFFTWPGDNKVHYFKFRESFCQNGSVNAVEPDYTYSRPGNNEGQDNEVQSPYLSKLQAMQSGSSTAGSGELAGKIIVYPNPAAKETTIALPVALLQRELRYVMTNSLGIVAAEGRISQTHTRLSLQSFAPGTYIVSIYDKQKNNLSHLKIVIMK